MEFARRRAEWEVLDGAVAADSEALRRVRHGDFTVDGRSRSDARWIVTYTVPDGPIAYYLYERPTQWATLLFVHRPKLTEYRLARMEPVEFPARDGLRLHG